MRFAHKQHDNEPPLTKVAYVMLDSVWILYPSLVPHG
jgi:hypothetical protein